MLSALLAFRATSFGRTCLRSFATAIPRGQHDRSRSPPQSHCLVCALPRHVRCNERDAVMNAGWLMDLIKPRLQSAADRRRENAETNVLGLIWSRRTANTVRSHELPDLIAMGTVEGWK